MTEPRAASAPTFTVYLLCFDAPVLGHRHYVGITTPARLHRRMIEHTTGRGASVTAEAVRTGTAWHLARRWQAHTRACEAYWRDRAELPTTCPLCAGIASGVRYSPKKKGSPRAESPFSRFNMHDPNAAKPRIARQLTLLPENRP